MKQLKQLQNQKGGIHTILAELLGMVVLVIGICVILNVLFGIQISVPELCQKLIEQIKAVF